MRPHRTHEVRASFRDLDFHIFSGNGFGSTGIAISELLMLKSEKLFHSIPTYH